MPDGPSIFTADGLAGANALAYQLWLIYNAETARKLASPFMGVTGAASMVYGVIGAIKEYEEIMCAIEDQVAVTERVLELTRSRFNRWRDVDLPYVLETQSWSLGIGWYKPSCGAIFSKWNSYASRAANASIGMDSRWRDRWRLGNWPGGGTASLSGLKGTIMAVAHVSMYKSMLDNYYESLGYKDKAVAASAGASYANEAFNESTKLLEGAAMGYNSILAQHAKGLGQYAGIAGKGAAMLANSNRG